MPFLDENGVTRLTEDYLDIFAPKEELGEGDGTNAGPIFELSAKGHAEQFSTSGKNIVKYPFESGSRELNGLTFTMNSDQSIRINGTPTDSVFYYLDRNLTLAAGTYTFSLGASIDSRHFVVYCGSGRAVYSNGSGESFTLSEEVTVELYIFTNANLGAIDVTIYPQLELGSEATDYEPYTGGAPSPSPDYPQEIQVVRGRNLLDVSNVEIGTAWNGNSNSARARIIVSVDKGQTYTISVVDSSSLDMIYINTTDSVPASDSGPSVISNSTFVATGAYLVIGFNKSNITRADIEDCHIQLTLGSTPQPYVPYGYVGMEVRKSCPIGTIPTEGINKYLKTDGSAGNSTGWRISNYIAFAGNMVSISGVTNDSATALCFYDKNMTFISGILYKNGFFDAPANAEYIRTSVLYLNYSTISIYGLTTTPIPLPDRGWVAGLPDGTSDILTLDGAGKCEWELPTAEADKDSNDWFLASSSVNSHGIGYIQKSIPSGIAGMMSSAIMSNIGIGTSLFSDSVKAEFASNGSNLFYRYPEQSTATLQNALSDMAARGAYCFYPLATPIHESKGYIEDWPTDIPEGATVTIPELDALNVKYFVANDSITKYAEQWHELIKAMDVAPVEDAIGDLTSVVANLVTHDLFYFGYDEVNGKKMISIFKRGDI